MYIWVYYIKVIFSTVFIFLQFNYVGLLHLKYIKYSVIILIVELICLFLFCVLKILIYYIKSTVENNWLNNILKVRLYSQINLFLPSLRVMAASISTNTDRARRGAAILKRVCCFHCLAVDAVGLSWAVSACSLSCVYLYSASFHIYTV